MARLDSPDFGEMLDTTPAARRRYYELLRQMTPEQKAAALNGATRAMRQLAILGIRSAHPDASEREVKIRHAVRLYGREAAVRMFGEAPDDAI